MVDGTRGGNFAQKEIVGVDNKEPTEEDDPQADVADAPSQEIKIGGDANKRYFLVGPAKKSKAPEKGYGIVVVLPGGDGSADFNPYVRRIFKNALPEGYVVAQPVAVNWSPKQQIVWPTQKNREDGMKFSTEEFIEAVVKDVGSKYTLDPARTFTLTWSSSGPAAHAAALGSETVTGSLVAMSVFKPDLLPPLEKAKGKCLYLYHSRDDRACPFRMAEQAERELMKNGATVKLATYAGGHGWRGDLYSDIRTGNEWLEKNHAPAPKR